MIKRAAITVLVLTIYGAAGCGRPTSGTDGVSESRNESLVRRAWLSPADADEHRRARSSGIR